MNSLFPSFIRSMPSKKIMAMLFVSLFFIVLAGCNKKKEANSSEQSDAKQALTTNSESSCENPETLSFSIIPHQESSQELKIFKPVIQSLEKNTGKGINFYIPTSYSSVVEAMVGGWVDISVLGPNSYLIAKEQDPSLEVFATYAKIKGHIQKEGPGYQSVLITKKGSKFTDIASLKGSVLGLVDPASTSGNLIPRVLFAKEELNGEKPESYFSKIVYTGQHDLSAIAVHEGKVDAAFVATHNFDAVVDQGLIKVDDFNYLWESPVIPQDPFVYRGSLCDDLKEKIKNTFLTLHENPEAKEFFKNIKAAKFVAMTDADYDVVRTLREAKKAQQ